MVRLPKTAFLGLLLEYEVVGKVIIKRYESLPALASVQILFATVAMVGEFYREFLDYAENIDFFSC